MIKPKSVIRGFISTFSNDRFGFILIFFYFSMFTFSVVTYFSFLGEVSRIFYRSLVLFIFLFFRVG